MNKLFDQKTGLVRVLKKLRLDELLNLRESLYEDRRKNIRNVREADAKLEMVDTQLNAIQFKRTREYLQSRGPEISTRRRRENRCCFSEKGKRSKENQDRWNILKEIALKKMSGGEKLTFEEMKLIYGENSSVD